MRRYAILRRILLYSIQTWQVLLILLSKKDYCTAVKALGDELCNFLVDTGSVADWFLTKVAPTRSRLYVVEASS